MTSRNCFLNLMTENFHFIKVFRQEQQKYINSSSSTASHYYLMIIKFCFNLAAKLSAYKDLDYHSITGSGPFLLASLNTLDDYKNYTKAARGLNLDVTNHLQETSCFSEIEKYITILLRKMKIQEDVVWDNILVSR